MLFIDDLISRFGNWDYSAQLLALVLALLVAQLLERIFARYFPKAQPGIPVREHERALKTLRRIIFPTTTIILLSIFVGIIRLLHLRADALQLAIPLFAALAVVRLMVFFLRSTLSGAKWLGTGESLISTIIWSGFVLYSLGWLAPASEGLDSVGFMLGSTRLSLLTLLKLAFLIGSMLLLSLWLSRQADRRLRKSRALDISTRVAIGKILKFVLITVALLMALSGAGIDISALAVFGGALGVGLGFGLQRIASNFVSGFILLFDRSIKPGDVITIGTKFGWVQELKARYVVVRDRDGVETLIPNENLVTSDVINWSYSDTAIRLHLPVQISYGDNPEQAMKIMINACKDRKRVAPHPIPVARMMGFEESGIKLELRIWIRDPQNGVANVRSDIYLAIWRGFKEAEITVPYPRLDVTLHHPQMDVPTWPEAVTAAKQTPPGPEPTTDND